MYEKIEWKKLFKKQRCNYVTHHMSLYCVSDRLFVCYIDDTILLNYVFIIKL